MAANEESMRAHERSTLANEDDVPREKKRPLRWLTSAIPPSLVPKIPSEALRSAHDSKQDYLIGVRGVLAIMSFLWMFMQTFVPAAVYSSANTTGPAYEVALGKSLSVLFWNGSLIYSSIIFLSARTICLPFLLDSTKTVLASAFVRRGIRMWFPAAAALIVCYIVFSKTLGTTYLTTFASETENVSMVADIYVLPSSLANFNSIFDLFWMTNDISYQAGSWAFPTQTLWIVSTLYQQSYTVFATMVVVPYTRTSWRVTGAFFFILTAWWVYSWAWFSISALLLADAVVNMDFKAMCQRHRMRTLAIAGFCMAAGFTMMFLWAAAFPDLINAEIDYHTGIYNTGGLYTWNDTTAPELRADNYLVIIGFYLLLESTDWLQAVFRNPVFTFLGQRSYSYFCLQSIIMYTLGIKTAMHTITNDSMSAYPRAAGVAFIACLLVTAAAGEVFHWLIDKPSEKAARLLFAWIRE